MTSAKFQTVPIGDIIVSRDERQRKKLTGLEELAASIREVGLINPPVVDRNMVLVAGERRLTACRDLLKWSSIPVQFAEDLDSDRLYLIELEENVKREDLTWQDQCLAMANYHEMRAKLEPNWTGRDTAKALNVAESEVASRRQVAQALVEGDADVAQADKYSVARGIVQRKRERRAAASVEQMRAQLFAPAAPAVEEAAELAVEIPEVEELLAAPRVPFFNADFIEWSANYEGVRFNFLHCDFPYGINAGKHRMGAAKAFGGYDDSEDVYWRLLDALADCMANVVADSAHMLFWFSMEYYHETKLRLESMGWTVNPFPLIWHKSDNSGILPDPRRGPRRVYETAFLCSRGDRFIAQPVSNFFAASKPKEIHMSEKSPEMLAYFFRMFVDESTTMLDPTMGSGNAVVVAESMGAELAMGLELNEEFYSRARDAYLARKREV